MRDELVRLGRAELLAWASMMENPDAAQWKCPRCGEVMESKDAAEGCEDWDCPASGGEQ